ncbi:hypothetical protein ACOIWC_004258, partial [Vibrio vulnificus]
GTQYKSYRIEPQPLNPMQTKNATRAKSLFNALLCLSFNDLRFTQTKINSTLIHKQKPKRRKQK